MDKWRVITLSLVFLACNGCLEYREELVIKEDMSGSLFFYLRINSPWGEIFFDETLVDEDDFSVRGISLYEFSVERHGTFEIYTGRVGFTNPSDLEELSFSHPFTALLLSEQEYIVTEKSFHRYFRLKPPGTDGDFSDCCPGIQDALGSGALFLADRESMIRLELFFDGKLTGFSGIRTSESSGVWEIALESAIEGVFLEAEFSEKTGQTSLPPLIAVLLIIIVMLLASPIFWR